VHPVRAFFINGATWGHIAESEVPRPEPLGSPTSAGRTDSPNHEEAPLREIGVGLASSQALGGWWPVLLRGVWFGRFSYPIGVIGPCC